jgi:integrase/recombinase XerD
MDMYLFNVLREDKYSSSHRHNMVTAFRSMYKFCCETRKYCSVNVAKKVKYIKVYTKERIYISELELTRIVKNIQSSTVRAVLTTIFYTGLRIGEAISLNLEDVNFEQEHVFVRAAKNDKERTIPMNEKLKKILTAYISDDRVDMGTNNFFSCRTGKISDIRVQEVLRETLQELGIEKQITPHTLRHSFASNLIERGVELIIVQKLMGHEHMKTTSIYLHSNMEELEKAVNML